METHRQRLTFAYFQDPPAWVRNLVGLLAFGLAFTGGSTLAARALPDARPPRLQSRFETPSGATTTTVPALDPAKFHAADVRFQVSFPGPPERTLESLSKRGQSVTATAYGVLSETTIYLVVSTPYSQFARTPRLRTVVDDEVELVDGLLQSTNARTFQGLRAMEAVYSSVDGTFRMLVVDAPGRIIQLAVVSDRDETVAYEAFRDSLVIL